MSSNLFSFPIQQSPLLEAGLPHNLRVDLSAEMRQVWETPQMSTLALNELEIMKAHQETSLFDYEQEWSDWFSRAYKARGTEEYQSLQSEFDVMVDEKNARRQAAIDEDIEAGRLLSQEELKIKYGDVLEIDREMTPDEAAVLYNQKTKEIIRQEVLARGDSGFIGGVAKIGVGILDIATDPLELAIGFVSALALPWTGGTLGARVGVGVLEGLVGGALTEPFYYSLSKRQQLDYTMNDALLNIAAGGLISGGFKGIFGARAKTDAPDYVPTDRERDLAHTALRQVINDEPVNFSPLMRDLRATTSLVSSRGVEFQPSGRTWLPEAAQPQAMPITTAVMGADGTPMRFATLGKAEAKAEQVGGSITRSQDGTYMVRQPIDGEFLRDSNGKPVTFETRRAAEKFIASTREDLLAEGSVPVPIFREQGRPLFGVASGIDPKRLKEIESGNARVEIPKGVSAKDIDNGGRIDAAVRGVVNAKKNAAYKDAAMAYARGQEAGPVETIIDVKHTVDQELKDAAEELEYYKAAVGDTLKEEVEIDAVTRDRIEGIKAAAVCMPGAR